MSQRGGDGVMTHGLRVPTTHLLRDYPLTPTQAYAQVLSQALRGQSM